jgi:hypothetical protein
VLLILEATGSFAMNAPAFSDFLSCASFILGRMSASAIYPPVWNADQLRHALIYHTTLR